MIFNSRDNCLDSGRYGSYIGEISPAPDNLLNRDFSADAPNEKWLTDITEFQIPAGKVYLSPMIDCFDGMVVSWSIGTRPNAELVNTMLDAAIDKVDSSGDRPVVHSDRGGHYRWPGWLNRIAEAKLVRSMSRKGCSPDNAACEGFFGRLKIEMFFERNCHRYGFRRIQAGLSVQSVRVSEKLVRRRMKQGCLVAAKAKRRRYGSYMGEISPAPDNRG